VTAGHVLLPRLCVAGQEDANRDVAQEDGHRVAVGFAEELAGRRSNDVLNYTAHRVAPPPPPSGMRGGTNEGRSEHQEAKAREPYDVSSPRRTRMHLLAALSGWILELAFRVHALVPLPSADRVVVPPMRLLIGRLAVKFRYGGPHARRQHLQALTAPATIPI
jgi:hypothetical protein